MYELDRDARELRKRGVLIRLQGRAVPGFGDSDRAARRNRHPGGTARADLGERNVCRLRSVTEQGCEPDLREALNDDASAPQYVETVPRRGYRFIASVEVHGKDDAPTRPISADTSGAIAHTTSALEFQPLQSLTTVAKDVTKSSRIRRRIAVITMASILVAALILGIWLVLPRLPSREY